METKKNNKGSGTKPLSKSPDSKRTRKRKNRINPFVDLETSSRMHRRALTRRSRACNIEGSFLAPGEKRVANNNKYTCTAGGSLNYHS